MKLLCKLGLHTFSLTGFEDGKGEHTGEFKPYQSCACGNKKHYPYGKDTWLTDNDLLGYRTGAEE